MPTISRRGFLALGAAGAAGGLAGCGSESDPRAEGRDGELLGAALAAEQAVQAAAEARQNALTGQARAVVEGIAARSGTRIDRLRALAADADAAIPEPVAVPPEGIELREPLDDGVAAYREASGLLSSGEARRFATASLAEAAAELAALRTLQDGGPIVPEPFVTGSTEPPFVAPESSEES